MGTEPLNERIKVVTFFDLDINPGKPMRFQRPNGQTIHITEIGLVHPTLQGRRMIHVFDVTDGQADYRLEFDAERLTWKLVYIKDEYGA